MNNSAPWHVVVIGAGTMGGGIAAHCANSGMQVTLLDIAADGADRNALVRAAWERQCALKPAALMHAQTAENVTLGNLADNFDAIGSADWVIEVIIEQLAAKQALMTRIAQIRKADSIISSNTSGIPITQIATGQSEDFQRHFLGTHFFNPPRYLKLLELIPTAVTDPGVLATIQTVAETQLGKHTVVCKDTPNFIGNRIGVLARQVRTQYALEHGYGIEEADALCGPVVGCPPTGIFRLSDVVGLDVRSAVTRNLFDAAVDDECRHLFRQPAFTEEMLARRWLGNKSGQGFYKEVKTADGGKSFWVLDPATLEYQPPRPPQLAVIDQTKQLPLAARLRALFMDATWADDRGARYVRETLLPILAYAARRIPEICDSPLAIDDAMRMGYANELGPFEIWDAIGITFAAQQMRARGIVVAAWVDALLASGGTHFYQQTAGRASAVWDPAAMRYVPIARHPLDVNLAAMPVLTCNPSASLRDLGDGVLCLEFHSKGNTLDGQSLAMAQTALQTLAMPAWRALVIGNHGKDFSLGANIAMLNSGITSEKDREAASNARQQVVQAIHFTNKPVVAATRGRALGGGAEVCLAAARMVMSAETQIGLTEMNVGIVPGWGGCKELLRRNLNPIAGGSDAELAAALIRIFKTLIDARVSNSALEARTLGFALPTDVIVANDAHVLGAAKREALAMAEAGHAALQLGDARIFASAAQGRAWLIGWRENQPALSEHSHVISDRLINILCGGDATEPGWVTEQAILDLERSCNLDLRNHPKTQERMAHLLKTGKPLRN